MSLTHNFQHETSMTLLFYAFTLFHALIATYTTHLSSSRSMHIYSIHKPEYCPSIWEWFFIRARVLAAINEHREDIEVCIRRWNPGLVIPIERAQLKLSYMTSWLSKLISLGELVRRFNSSCPLVTGTFRHSYYSTCIAAQSISTTVESIGKDGHSTEKIMVLYCKVTPFFQFSKI